METLNEMFVLPSRKDLKDHLLRIRAENGSEMPLSAVDEIVDIACHAAESSRRVLVETIERASHPSIATTAVGIATSLLKHDIALLEGALRDFAAANDKPIYETTVAGEG